MNSLLTYVSNLDRRVFTIDNLPEEVIAVVFAYVSRSPKGFRENLAKLLEEGQLQGVRAVSGDAGAERAQKIAGDFHERWVIGYGHSSVAEHAVVHVGIEGISRLASAELELGSRFNSFTEYSQRYQRPRRGAVYFPPELQRDPEALNLYKGLQDRAFDVYEALYEGLVGEFARRVPRRDGESERSHRIRVEKAAFEDARYALTLATLTNLGLTGNGRALRDAIVHLLSGPYTECRDLAVELAQEVAGRLPTLLRHISPSDYLRGLARTWAVGTHGQDSGGARSGPEVEWLSLPDYRESLVALVTGLWLAHGGYDFEEARRRAEGMDSEDLEDMIRLSWEKLTVHDHPHGAFKTVVYRILLRVSEANWHQLLRHNRGADFTYGVPGGAGGWVIPPRVEEAGLAGLLTDFLAYSDEVREKIRGLCPEAVPYCVTNAHRREVVMTVNLWELYHLINLRTSPEAQWDIRQAFEMIDRELRDRHPALMGGARRRSGVEAGPGVGR